jgi:5-methylcytosine-specific restriction endonuclease McrA
MKKKPPFNQNAAIRGAIRRIFSRSPIVREVLMAGRRQVPKFNKDGSRAKVDSVQYQCQSCNQWVGSTLVSVDHIVPVISTADGFVDWNEFVNRLFCKKENLQRICDPCHDKKTHSEKVARLVAADLRMYDSFCSQTGPVSKEAEREFVKKYTKKRLTKYPYPKHFVDGITNIRRSIGLKV